MDFGLWTSARKSILLGLAFTALTLALHFAPIWENMLNRGAESWDEQPAPRDYIESVIAAHSDGSDPAFARRPWTTIGIRMLTSVGLAPKQAFITVGLCGFLFAGVLVYLIAMRFGLGERNALLSQALFHLSPTVLCAWYDPLYTYDEPIQYAAALGALLALVHQRWVIYVPVLLLALMARETSLLLLPAFFLVAPRRRPALVASLVSASLFTAWIMIAPQGASASDFAADLSRRSGYFALNFSPVRIGETIGFMLLVLALPLFLLLRHRALVSPGLFRAFVIVLVLNTPLVLVGAYAREARLFALPLLIAWPWLGSALVAEIDRHGGWNGIMSAFRSPVNALLLIAATAIIIVCTYAGFTLTATGQEDNLFHELLIAQAIIIAASMIASRKGAG